MIKQQTERGEKLHEVGADGSAAGGGGRGDGIGGVCRRRSCCRGWRRRRRVAWAAWRRRWGRREGAGGLRASPWVSTSPSRSTTAAFASTDGLAPVFPLKNSPLSVNGTGSGSIGGDGGGEWRPDGGWRSVRVGTGPSARIHAAHRCAQEASVHSRRHCDNVQMKRPLSTGRVPRAKSGLSEVAKGLLFGDHRN